MDATAATIAADEIRNYNFPPLEFNMRYPHWVNYVRSLLESKYDAQTIYRSGFTVTTTLDPQLQDEAQRILTEQVVDARGQKRAQRRAGGDQTVHG